MNTTTSGKSIMTSFENKCAILSDLWMNYRDNDDFRDFIEYNDLGLPLAHFINAKIVETTELSTRFIEETFDLLLKAFNVEDDDFETMDDIMDAAEAKLSI